MSDDKPKPQIYTAPEPVHLNVIDPSKLTALENGCPRCSEYPDFPRRHCGLPGCRDEQAIAYAAVVGLDADEIFAAMDTHEVPPGGLCGDCRMVSACVVGLAVMDTQGSLEAVIAHCDGYKPA